MGQHSIPTAITERKLRDRMKRTILQLVCAFCLLFAQQSALTHAVWHAHGDVPVKEDSKHKSSLQDDLCNLHGLFTQVVGGASTAVLHVPASDAVHIHALELQSSCISARLPAPRSRGPPLLS
jgi:hypothetical protein